MRPASGRVSGAPATTVVGARRGLVALGTVTGLATRAGSKQVEGYAPS